MKPQTYTSTMMCKCSRKKRQTAEHAVRQSTINLKQVLPSNNQKKKLTWNLYKTPQHRESQVVGGGIKRLAPTIGLNVAKLDGRKPRAARDLTGTVPRPPTACPPCAVCPLHGVLLWILIFSLMKLNFYIYFFIYLVFRSFVAKRASGVVAF